MVNTLSGPQKKVATTIYTKVSIEDGSMQQITDGDWEVTSYHGMHSENGKVYYTSTEDGAINRSVYSINLDGTDKQKLTDKIGNNSLPF